MHEAQVPDLIHMLQETPSYFQRAADDVSASSDELL